MDTFLQTELPAIVWASLLAVVVGLYLLRGGKHRAEPRGAVVGVLLGLIRLVRVVIALAFIAAGVGSFLIGRQLQQYPILEGRDPVGVVQIWWTRGDSGTMLNMSRQDDPLAQAEELIQIPGSMWAIQAQVIRWPSWGEPLGLRPIYRLQKLLAWGPIVKQRPSFTFDFPYSKIGFWNQILKYGKELPGVMPPETVTSRRVTATENTLYRIVITPEEIEINPEPTRATPILPMEPGETS